MKKTLLTALMALSFVVVPSFAAKAEKKESVPEEEIVFVDGKMISENELTPEQKAAIEREATMEAAKKAGEVAGKVGKKAAKKGKEIGEHAKAFGKSFVESFKSADKEEE